MQLICLEETDELQYGGLIEMNHAKEINQQLFSHNVTVFIPLDLILVGTVALDIKVTGFTK